MVVNETVAVLTNVTNHTSYHMCNIMTGKGFDTSFLGGYGMAWLGVVILFFIIALTRKWIGEEMGIPFTFIGSLVFGYIAYFGVVTVSCSFKWALLLGLIIAAAVGFFASEWFGEM